MNEVMITGSFDPITLGHMDIIKRAAKMFDRIAVVMFINPEKKYMFTLEQRLSMIKASCEMLEGIRVDYSEGTVVDYARDHGIKTIVRGVRNSKDYEYERTMESYNKMHGGLETVFLFSNEDLKNCSSTVVRDIIENKGDLDSVLPCEIIQMKERPF